MTRATKFPNREIPRALVETKAHMKLMHRMAQPVEVVVINPVTRFCVECEVTAHKCNGRVTPFPCIETVQYFGKKAFPCRSLGVLDP